LTHYSGSRYLKDPINIAAGVLFSVYKQKEKTLPMRREIELSFEIKEIKQIWSIGLHGKDMKINKQQENRRQPQIRSGHSFRNSRQAQRDSLQNIALPLYIK
jgi:hypothetical protein